MWWRVTIALSMLVIAGVAVAHFRSEMSDRPDIAGEAARSRSITMSSHSAGGEPIGGDTSTYYEASGFDLSEGKRLYRWFNCVGCHANGGGDIGPPLMDDKWIYGSHPRNVLESIMRGRPNGMPSFAGKIPEAQAWQITAYVRSMSGLTPFYSRPGRNDDMQATRPEVMAPSESPIRAGPPDPSGRR